jgi:hypothetical protein
MAVRRGDHQYYTDSGASSEPTAQIKLRASVRHWYRWLRGESLRNDSNNGWPPHS